MRTVQVCVVASALVAQAPAPELKSLAWLQGRWTGAEGPERFEEHWSLQGQSLMGSARTLVGDTTSFIELFILEREGADFVLRIRMFGPALDSALKGKDAPLRLKLTEADSTHFKCEGLGPETGTTLIYRLEAPDRIHASLSKAKDGRVSTRSYAFTRGTH
ncbi:MAG: hypothetical protein HYZ13_12435 [Acidobacteria bacterium]|nr:hypothetical protein [Acidobacteriota bacterium]